MAANPAIDGDRILIGGCSNGGYMTMEMILHYPDRFAAAFPIYEACEDALLSQEQLASISSLSLWFTYSRDDLVVLPDLYSIPTIQRLQDMSSSVRTSVFNTVHDTSGLYYDANGRPYEYSGHWSWIYFFNNECAQDGLSLWQWMAQQHRQAAG